MTTGLLDFADHGKITGTPLSATDVKEWYILLMKRALRDEPYKWMLWRTGSSGGWC